MKLSLKIYLFFICSAVVIIAMITGVTYYFTRDLLLREQYRSYTNLAEFTARRVDESIYNVLISVRSLATRETVEEAFSGAFSAKLAEIRENLTAVKDIDGHIEEIYLIDLDGNIVISTDEKQAVNTVSGLSVQERILEKISSGAIAYSDVFMAGNTGKPSMIVAAPVFDRHDGGKVLGAVEIYLNWNSVLEILEDTGATFVHLINGKGLEIGSNEPEHYEDILKEDYSQREDYHDLFESDSDSDSINVTVAEDLHGGFQSIMTHIDLKGHLDYGGNDWILVLEESIESVIGAINKSAGNVAVLTFTAMLLFSAVMVFSLRKYVIYPLAIFSDTSRRIVEGNKDLRVPDWNRKDEIGILAKNFNYMVDGFQSISRDLEARVHEKTFQLERELELSEYKTDALEKSRAATLNLLEDVSVEKERSAALVLELNKFELAVENAYEQIVISDPDGVVIYANKAAERITGYSRGEIIGSRPSLWGGQMPKEFYEKMWKTIKTDRKVFLGQLRNRRKSGEIYDVDMQISPIIDGAGDIKFFVAIERDITEQKKLEDARTNFISVASHQLRTPLTSIKWISEILMSGDVGPVNDKQNEFINDLYISSNRMIELVNSLLNIARIESTQLRVKAEKVNFPDLYANVIKEFELAISGRRHSIALEMGEGASELRSDPRLLYEILKNIISNSIKYTKDGGIIKVRVEKQGGKTVISVRDNGIGIPKSQQDRLFTKFFRADNAVKINTDGTGLGMYIVRNLMDLLNGKIWFESEEDKGTAVFLSLPEAGPEENPGSKSLVGL